MIQMIIYLRKYVTLLFFNKWRFSLLMYYFFFVWKVDCQRNLRSIVQCPSKQVKVLWSWRETCVKWFWGKMKRMTIVWCEIWKITLILNRFNAYLAQCHLETIYIWILIRKIFNLRLWVIFPTVLKSIHTCTTRVICSSSYSISVSRRAS